MFSLAPAVFVVMRCTLVRLFIIALVLSFTACGGGGGGSGTSVDSTPSISNLQFSSTSALQNDNNGALEVTVTFDYADSGKDLSTIYVKYPDGRSVRASISGVQGTASGSIQGTLTINTNALGNFNFEIYVTDSQGRRSNNLIGNFVVNPNDSASRWSTQSFPVAPGASLLQKRVRWFGSLYVTVGDSIFTSSNAVTWAEQSSGLSTRMNDVSWTGSQFIVVGDNGAILTSPNATIWTPRIFLRGYPPPH